MQTINKLIRNLTIGTIAGGLIGGGASTFVLNNKKPFIRDLVPSYQVNTDTTIKTTDGIIKLKPPYDFSTEEQIENMNELEVKSYIPSKDNYDVEVYGFKNGILTSDEKIKKQEQFENGNTLSTITNFDNHDEYQVEAKELPTSYKNILEEINIKTIDYDSVIKVRESRKDNLKDTTFWLLMTAVGSVIGFIGSNVVNELSYKVKKKLK